MNKRLTLCLLLLLTLFAIGNAQEFAFDKYQKDKAFAPIIAIESWAVYSACENASNNDDANRTDVMFRRFRFGAKGNPYHWLKYSFQLHMDHFGEDIYTSVNGKDTGIGVWNAYLTARLLKNSELLNLHVGYLWAAVSREYMTSWSSVSSLDKVRSNWALRNFVSGKGNGIESGIALGGLVNFESFGLNYRLGIYEPQNYACSRYADKLFTGRLMFSFGEPEQEKYTYMLKNKLGERPDFSLVLGAGLSSQAKGCVNDTVYFTNSHTYGADIRCVIKNFSLDGEYFIMKRQSGSSNNYNGEEYHLRLTYLLSINRQLFEISTSHNAYEGRGDKLVYRFIGDDNSYDVGCNWLINKHKLKLSAHYVFQNGNISNSGDYAALALQLCL